MTYELVTKVSKDTLKSLRKILKKAVWKDVIGDGRDYRTWHGLNALIREVPELAELLPPDKWHQTWFLKFPPGGTMEKHRDVELPWITYFITISTNKKYEHIMYAPDEKLCRFPTGSVNLVDRQVVHEVKNNGDSDVIHLLVEVLKDGLLPPRK